MATCRSVPTVRPEAASSSGTTTSSTVPGGTVERMTTVCGRSVPASTEPISLTTRLTWVRSVLPFAADGVPTQTSERSEDCRPSPTDPVARSAPDPTTCSTSSSRPGSITGGVPAFSAATLPGSVSTPTTRCPRAARQVAVTEPT